MCFKKQLLVLMLLSVAVAGYAQVRGGKPVIKAVHDFNIVHNVQIGQAVLQMSRPLGKLPAVANTVPFSFSLPQQSFRALVPALSRKISQATLPGYFQDFKVQFPDYAKAAEIPVEYWSAWLGRGFNQDKSFQGHFLKDFKSVVELLDVPVVEGGTSLDAINEAFAEGLKSDGRGFFVISQAANRSRAKDVFVLDIKGGSWISLKTSRGRVLGKQYNSLRQTLQETNSSLEEMLAKRGVLVRVDNPTKPTELEVSLDGIRWDRYSMETQTAQKLWAGWKEGVYISYRKRTGAVLYSEKAHAPMFNSLEVLQEFIHTK